MMTVKPSAFRLIRRSILNVPLMMFVVLCASVSALAQSSSYRPQEGRTVVFIVPDGTPIYPGPYAFGPDPDLVVFTGRSVGRINLEGCVTGEFDGPLQSATVLDPGDQRAMRLTNEIIVIDADTLVRFSEIPPIAAGTRLRVTGIVTSCYGPGGLVYQMYASVVE